MEKIKKGDEIVVIAGRDKGKRGTVSKRVDDSHLIVEGINRAKKHTKPNPMKGITDPYFECCAVQSADPEGRSGGHQVHRRRGGCAQGSVFQVERRSHRREITGPQEHKAV